MDIRRADAKGRLTGFKPKMYYRIQETQKGVEVVKLEPWDVYNLDEVEFPLPAPLGAQEYLKAHGIDPRRVSASGSNMQGYAEFVLDSEGKRVDDYGESKTVRKPWPEGFIWDEFVRHLLEGETEPA